MNTLSRVREAGVNTADVDSPGAEAAPADAPAARSADSSAPVSVECAAGAAALGRTFSPRARYWVVTAAHLTADMYPQIIFSLAVALSANLSLSGRQMALLFALNPIASGLSQPIFAWVTDRFDTRVCGPLGLALAAACLSSVGFAQSFSQLIGLQIVGMTGVGMLHPVLAALAGELGAAGAPRWARSARGLALSIFFAAGMAGGVLGPIAATRINEHAGMAYLTLMALPGLVFAAALVATTLATPHRPSAAGTGGSTASSAPARRITRAARNLAVGVLFASNTLRFVVNIGLFYLFARWAAERLPDADRASSLSGDLIASAQFGMGASALALGWMVRAGRERTPLILSGVLAAPAVALMPWLGSGWMHVAAGAAAAGFFGMIPQSIAAAQRLLPASTGVAGAIMMGCGWTISALGPEIAKAMEEWTGSLAPAFWTLAGLMALSGLTCLAIPRGTLAASALRG